MIVKNPTFTYWMGQNGASKREYLANHVDKHSRILVDEEFKQQPFVGMTVIRDYKTNKKDVELNRKKFLYEFNKPGSFVITIVGMPDSGKTTTAYAIAELIKNTNPQYNIVQLAPVEPEEGSLPPWIKWKSNSHQMEKNDVCIKDEAGVNNMARRSNTNENIDDLMWLPVGRHVGAKVIYITQLSALSDVNIARFTNIFINKGFKSSSEGVAVQERGSNGDDLIPGYMNPDNINEGENYAGVPSVPRDWASIKAGGTYFRAFFPQPAFMTNTLSKTFMSYMEKSGGDLKEAIVLAWKDAAQMKRDGHTARTIYTQVKIRGITIPLTELQEFTGEAKEKRGGTYKDYT